MPTTWTSGGGRGAAGDDQGPATARQQGPGRTDADVTARGEQGSECAAGDPAARPRGPPPIGPESHTLRNRRATPACSMRRRIVGGSGPGWTDDPGQTRQRVQRRGSRRPEAWASADMASEPPVKGQCLPLVPGGAVAGSRGPGWTDGPGRTGPRAQDQGSRRPGVWQRYV